jgi:hypothetical protein
MKRTAFKKKPYQWTIKPKKEGKTLIPKKETKDEEWRRIKVDILDPFFKAKNLYNGCELLLDDICIGNVLKLCYAHSKKRDDIALEEPQRTQELCEVVRACPSCHNYIEYLPERKGISGKEQMYKIVTDAISRRNRRLARWKRVT